MTTPHLAPWGWVHRIWHWLFAIAIVVSSYTGFVGGIELMDWHVRSGVCVIALLLFRFGWAGWGDPAVRLRRYRTSTTRMWQQLRDGTTDSTEPHTAAGAAMAIALTAFVSIQATSGLFASDDISTDGPFAGRVGHSGVDVANAFHTRVYWIIWTLSVVHVAAIAWYRWRGDPAATSMGTATARAAPRQYGWRAALTLAAALGLVWIGVRLAS
jgi:cytochrome b